MAEAVDRANQCLREGFNAAVSYAGKTERDFIPPGRRPCTRA